MRYTYARGYKSRESALDAIDDMMSDGDVGPLESPKVEPYKARRKADGKQVTRYAVTLEDGWN